MIIDLFPESPSSIPRGVGIQVHNSCNSRCIMCGYRHTHKKHPYQRISMGSFTKIIDEFLGLDIKRFSLSLQCEALHDPDIFERIKYIKSSGGFCGISTNGLLLTSKTTDKLGEYGLDILAVSLNALSEEMFEYVHGVEGFDNYENNIIYAIENKPANQFIAFNSMLVKKNYSQLKSKKHKIFDLIEKHNIKSRMGPIGNHCGSLPSYSELVIVPEEQSSTKKLYCHDIFESVYILSDGSIIGCCSDYRRKYILGNIKNQRFVDIWNDRKTQKRRHDMMYRNLYELEPCKDCSQAWNIMRNRGIKSAEE